MPDDGQEKLKSRRRLTGNPSFWSLRELHREAI